ncbi:pilus assembly FimT family protein [Oceanithermus sp.]
MVRKSGFTLIEMLIVIGMLAVLMGLGYSSFSKVRGRLGLEESANRVAQDIQKCRSIATTKTLFCRLTFTDAHSYTVATSNNRSSWNTQFTASIGPDVVASWSAGDSITFNSRGFAVFPATPSPYQITLSQGNETYVIVPTMVGAVRVVRQ